MAAEQFRFLRRTLEQKFPQGGILLVTSPAPRDGKTLTTVNLCSCLANAGRSTILLEGDIRQPSIHRLLGGTNVAPGIEHALAGTVEPTKAIHFVEELKLHVSMVVDPPADPSNLVSGSGAKSLLAWARQRFHWVVNDSPPVLPAADVTQLAALADATLLVVRAQSTPRDLVVRACELLGDHLFGVVLNEATVESNPYYRHLSEYRQKVAVPSRREAARGEELNSSRAVDADSIGAPLQ
jgi:capsular exopolysaccharide synthesis family protein